MSKQSRPASTAVVAFGVTAGETVVEAIGFGVGEVIDMRSANSLLPPNRTYWFHSNAGNPAGGATSCFAGHLA